MANRKKKKDTRVLMARNTIIGFISAIAIAILAFGTYVSTGIGQSSEFALNKDFVELPNSPPRREGDPIEVYEFFSYTCIHCKTFDPVIEEWAEEQPDDVVFERRPVSFNPIATLLAQTYLTLEQTNALEQNHARIFRAIHDAGRDFLTVDMIGDYVDGRGISKEEFIKAFNSPDVRRAMRRAERQQRDWQIASTPSMVVAERYLVSMQGGQRRALDVLDHLVNKIRNGEPIAGTSDTSAADAGD